MKCVTPQIAYECIACIYLKEIEMENENKNQFQPHMCIHIFIRSYHTKQNKKILQHNGHIQ